MKHNKKVLLVLAMFLSALILPMQSVKALPPPDMIYNVMQQLPQIIGMVFAFFSMGAVGIYNFLNVIGKNLKFTKWHWIGLIVILCIISVIVGYLITSGMQQEYLNSTNN